jgi:DNA-binding transcriptional MerR regulator
MMGDGASKLPEKLYYRIGEVASLVGVEPHVLRYWEREFRTIRPRKSARGQRVYSRRDVETLMRVRELLYSEGFTIAGARRRLQQERSGNGQALEPLPGDLVRASDDESNGVDGASEDDENGESDDTASAQPLPEPARARRPAIDRSLPLFEPGMFAPEREPSDARARARVQEALAIPVERRVQAGEPKLSEVRSMLREMRGEIETFLDDLG